MDERIYCFVGFKSDDASHAVDLRDAADDAAAMAEAEVFLRNHRSCAYVEVWRSKLLIGVSRPAGTEPPTGQGWDRRRARRATR